MPFEPSGDPICIHYGKTVLRMLTEIPYYHSFYALQNLKKPTDPICSCHAFFYIREIRAQNLLIYLSFVPYVCYVFCIPKNIQNLKFPPPPQKENNEKKRNNKECHLNKTLQHSVREQYWGLFHVPLEVAACFIYAKFHLSCFSAKLNSFFHNVKNPPPKKFRV